MVPSHSNNMAARSLLVSLGTITQVILSVRTQNTPHTVPNSVWAAQNFPNPQNQPAACGMPASSWICDPSHIISPNSYATSSNMIGDTDFLDKMIKQTDRGTQGVCKASKTEGYRMAIGVVRSIQNPIGVSLLYPQQAADQFADYLRQGSWSPGSCGNDVLVVLELSTRSIGVSVGSEARTRLSIDEAKKLAETASKRLTGSNAGQELGWLLAKYQNHLMGMNNSVTPYEIFLAAWGVILGGALVIMLVACLIKYGYRGCKDEQKKPPLPIHREHSIYH